MSGGAVRVGIERMRRGILVLFVGLLLAAVATPLAAIVDWPFETARLVFTSLGILSWGIGAVAGAFLLFGILELLEGAKGKRILGLLVAAVVSPLALFLWGWALGLWYIDNRWIREIPLILARVSGALFAGLLFLVALNGLPEPQERRNAGWAISLGIVAVLVDPLAVTIREAAGSEPVLGIRLLGGYVTIGLTFVSLLLLYRILRDLGARLTTGTSAVASPVPDSSARGRDAA